MIVLDTNILLYAYNPSFAQHEAARTWLEQTLGHPSPVGLPWSTIMAFLRISTNPRAFPRPLTPGEAVDIVAGWLAHPTVLIIQPGERHWEILQGVLLAAQARGPQVMDAHLAALTIEHGAVLCTTDRSFRLFAGLRTRNPLEGSP